MPLKLTFQRYTLDFKFDAGTSRGVLKEKDTYFLKVVDLDRPDLVGIGESGPLKKLSIDDVPDFETNLQAVCEKIQGIAMPKSVNEIFELAESVVSDSFPSVRFGLETALLDLLHEGQRTIFQNSFRNGEPIPINGLIWMGHTESMLLQINDKIEQEYDCIKLKIGSLDFEKECDILQYVRSKYYDKDIMLRVDANGAFHPEEVMNKLTTLSKFKIHSIEQPIKAGQTELMKKLCEQTPLDIALDEELIGISDYKDKNELLEYIRPQYIILKPTLLGGFKASMEWIELANNLRIGWWLTSALESNIGLNAICQFSAELDAQGYQGLGTGQLYHNNIPSPLQISKGHIAYHQDQNWDLSFLT